MRFRRKIRELARMQSPAIRTSARVAMDWLKPRWIALTSIVVGLILLTYVASQYAEMYRSQREMAKRWWDQQTTAHANRTGDPTLTRLIIPKIGLDDFVVEGTSRKALLMGPGHLKNSAEPGESGNAVISAHRDTFFRHVYDLEKGDRVTVERGGNVATYEVTAKRVVDPDDLEVIQPTKDSRLTLITCYPTYYVGPAPYRAIVIAKLVSLRGTDASAESSTNTPQPVALH